MKRIIISIALCASSLCLYAEWKPAPVTVTTPWGEKVTPENALREYPRPQFVRRGDWKNLNGLWDYAILKESDDFETLSGPMRGPKRFDGKILVPFAVETSLSGVGHLLEPDEHLWYSRSIDVKLEKGRRTLLNFEGVDFRAQVFLNGVEVLDVPHEGMNVPFSVDITDFAKNGANLLQVAAWDPTEKFINSTGKQVFNPSGCMYTRMSGIWQTVWTESVPDDYIVDWKVSTDWRKGSVRFDFVTSESGKAPVAVEIRRNGKTVAKGRGGETIALPKPVALWSPDSPALYDAVFTWKDDVVDSYFAVRQLELAKDASGTPRFALNGEIVYLQGTLDQGWWPESALTPPSEEAMAFDIKLLKDVGYNMMRKHIKVEPRRYYALCDRMGIMVLQDMPSGVGDRVNRYGFYRKELKEMIDHLANVPSVVMWVPYNESWSQPHAKYTIDTLAWVKRYDPSRLVNGPSGWNDFEGGLWHTGWYKQHWESPIKDIPEFATHSVDLHLYPGPGMHKLNPDRASFLGEFGGIGLKIAGHQWKPDGKNWGYVSDEDVGKSFARYSDIMARLACLARRGLAGSVYTQTTDVEIEINGLTTYDRKVVKYDVAKLRALHEAVYRAAAEGAKTAHSTVELFPRRDQSPTAWAYSFEEPAEGWTSSDFNDAAWKRSAAGFANDETAKNETIMVSTKWTTSDLWVRREFEYDGRDVLDAWLDMFHDEDTEVYLNGELVLSVKGFNNMYMPFDLDREKVKKALRKGRNVLSAHVRQTIGGQYLDMGLFIDAAK